MSTKLDCLIYVGDGTNAYYVKTENVQNILDHKSQNDQNMKLKSAKGGIKYLLIFIPKGTIQLHTPWLIIFYEVFVVKVQLINNKFFDQKFIFWHYTSTTIINGKIRSLHNCFYLWQHDKSRWQGRRSISKFWQACASLTTAKAAIFYVTKTNKISTVTWEPMHSQIYNTGK